MPNLEPCASALVAIAECSSTTPLGRPVLPLVKIDNRQAFQERSIYRDDVGHEPVKLGGARGGSQHYVSTSIFEAGLQRWSWMCCIQWHRSAACLENREHGDDRKGTLVEAGGHEHLRSDSELDEMMRQAIRGGFQLAVRVLAVMGTDRWCVWLTLSPSGEYVVYTFVDRCWHDIPISQLLQVFWADMIQGRNSPLGIKDDVLEGTREGVRDIPRLYGSDMVCPVIQIYGRCLVSNFDIDTDWIFGGIVDRSDLTKVDVLFRLILLVGQTTIGKRSVEETRTRKLEHVLNVGQGNVTMWQGFHVVSLYILKDV
jgi:hypothetical protein